MGNLNGLKKGFARFYNQHFVRDDLLYQKLATEGQFPQTLVIACSDSRVAPSIVLDSQPGDIFVIRNVANLVPPYQPKADSYHGTSAALEFGVRFLEIPNILVLGHSQCAGIKALVEQGQPADNGFSFIQEWVKIAEQARVDVQHEHGDHIHQACEKGAIKVSLDNLLTFPWIKERVDKGLLTLHGWYFCINEGKMEIYNPETGEFDVLREE